jgi:hypothetical protein
MYCTIHERNVAVYHIVSLSQEENQKVSFSIFLA